MYGITSRLGLAALVGAFDGLKFERKFELKSAQKHMLRNSELLALDLQENGPPEPPGAMTGNDAFRIIEIILEREALRARFESED
ncbi:MAG TPA: hypothetical protein ENK57_26175 [Polyangiaceae bacterium]|nr:hypothetical protein [Polyangiaceae bacterium]